MKLYIYGHKRNYKKIDIFVNGVYRCSTTWAPTLKVAKQEYLCAFPTIGRIQAARAQR